MMLGYRGLLAAAVLGLQTTGSGAAADFIIGGAGKVVDGWVSSGGAGSFADRALQAHGAAWGAYHRVLVSFDLSGIDPSEHGRVRRAVLRLQVTGVANEAGVETSVAVSDTAWSASASFGSPDGQGNWPARAGNSNIDYAMSASGRAGRVITGPGQVELDVTEAVGRWLYQGVPNYGFLIATGPTIWGAPDAGTWRLEFASSEAEAGGPELVVEMEGTPPTPETAEARALALYPSPLLPPVRDPYVFVWYGAFEKKLWEQFTVSNMVTYSGIGSWLAPRGALDLTWGEGGPIDWLPTQEAWERYYVGIAEHNLGYCMHEWHMPADSPDAGWAVNAAREAKRKHPACFAAFYFQGQESMARLAAEGGLDLLISEGYTHVLKEFPMEGFQADMEGIKRRDIDGARKAGAIEKLVVMLGHIAPFEEYHPGHELTPDVVDEMVRDLRAYAPEMPGIGFYFAGGEELAVQCDALARKYFVEPAPEVVIAEPAFEAKLTAAHVTVRAEATPKDDRTVSRYRWFIDNRLVAETAEPRYVWDIRGETPGRHFVTVHAVDSGYNRAAAQIPVQVRLPDGGAGRER